MGIRFFSRFAPLVRNFCRGNRSFGGGVDGFPAALRFFKDRFIATEGNIWILRQSDLTQKKILA